MVWSLEHSWKLIIQNRLTGKHVINPRLRGDGNSAFSVDVDSLSLEGPRMRLWVSLDAEPLLLPLGRHTEKGH